ncbi:acyltransferase domain-containing protein [Pedobacter sp. NJ-S-72]
MHIAYLNLINKKKKKKSVVDTPHNYERYFLPISAKTVPALEAYCRLYIQAFELGSERNFQDICLASSLLNNNFNKRQLFSTGNKTEMLGALENFLQLNKPFKALDKIKNKIVMVFPGQGSQWLGMGKELFLKEPVFKETIIACDKAFKPYKNWSLIELLTKPETNEAERIDIIQPILFAIEVAIAKLWKSWGVVPDIVVGHSMGEIAATHLSGMLTLEDAAKIICTRSGLMQGLSGQNSGMLVTELPLTKAETILLNYPDISIAAINSPCSTVLSGPSIEINKLIKELEAAEIFCRRVKVDVASHSQQMDAILTEFKIALRDLQPGKMPTPLFSPLYKSDFLKLNS